MNNNLKTALVSVFLSALNLLVYWQFKFSIHSIGLTVVLGLIAVCWNVYCAHEMVNDSNETKLWITLFVAVAFIWVALGAFFEWRTAILSLIFSGWLQTVMLCVGMLAMCGWLCLSLTKKDELYVVLSQIKVEDISKKCDGQIIFGFLIIVMACVGQYFMLFHLPSWCFAVLCLPGLFMVCQYYQVLLLLVHVAAEGGITAQGLFSQTRSFFYAFMVWAVAAFCEFVIDVSSLSQANTTYSNSEQVHGMKKFVVFCASLSYGVCVVLLAVYLWPQMMQLIGHVCHVLPVALSVSGLGMMGYAVVCACLSLGGFGAACFVYQNLMGPQHDADSKVQQDGAQFGDDMVYGRIFSLVCVLLLILAILYPIWAVCIAMPLMIFVWFSPKVSYASMVSSCLVNMITGCTCLLTGVLGALLFSNLMGFSAYVTCINVIAAGCTDFSVYHRDIKTSVRPYMPAVKWVPNQSTLSNQPSATSPPFNHQG